MKAIEGLCAIAFCYGVIIEAIGKKIAGAGAKLQKFADKKR